MSESSLRAFIPAADVTDVVRRSGGDRSLAALPVGGVTAVSGLRRAWVLVDVAGILAIGAALAITPVPWLAVLAVPAALALVLVDLVRSGSTPAHRLLALRTVASQTALPPSVRDLFGVQLFTADLRHGADPLQIAPGSVPVLPVPRVDPWAPDATRAGGHVVLILDDGSRVSINGPSILGRRPSDPAGGRMLVQVTDLSRTLARNHVAVAPHLYGLEVTDLGSAHGTSVAETGESFTFLAAGVPVVVPLGSRLRIGARLLIVTDYAGIGS